MKLQINNIFKYFLPALAMATLISSCNKDLPEAEPIVVAPPSGATIMETLGDPSYSFLKAAITRASTFNSPTGKLSTLLSDKTGVYTLFAPDDNAFKASLAALGLPADIGSINFLSPGLLDTIIKYHIVGGQRYTSA